MDGRDLGKAFTGAMYSLFVVGCIIGLIVGVVVVTLGGWLARHLSLGWR